MRRLSLEVVDRHGKVVYRDEAIVENLEELTEVMKLWLEIVHEDYEGEGCRAFIGGDDGVVMEVMI